MTEITAAQVKAFRERTGLPLMECKTALQEAGGDEEKAIAILRERGEKLGAKRASRETAFGRYGIVAGLDQPVGAIVELKCESAPVAQNEEFAALADDMAKALAAATEPVETVDQLLALPSPSKPDITLKEQMSELFNRIREKFAVGRFARLEGPTVGYFHNLGTVIGVLVRVEGGDEESAKNVAMHIAAMKPTALNVEDLDQEEVNKEREYLRAAALKEGKPENIVEKIVEGRLRQFYAERVLTEQPFVKDDKQTVGEYAKSKGMEIKEFVCFVMGQDS